MKQTEIGLIPEDWEVKELGEICDVLGGGTPKTNISEYWKDEINWFTPSEIGNKKYVSESIRKISKVGLHNSSAKLLPKGTILLTTRASIGETSILLNPAATNQGFQSLVVKNDNIDYIYYLVETLKNTLIQNASGSTFLEISPNKVKSIQIPLPPLAEQEAIANALSDADAWIEKLEQLIAKKRLIKQGAMQTLLTPKEDWEVKKLGEVADIITGGTPSTSIKEYWGTDFPWITPTDIGITKDIYKGERGLSKQGIGQIRRLPKNSLLVTCIASIGKNSILRMEGACNQQINALVPHPLYDVDFLYYLIELNKHILQGKAGITATPILSKAEFSLIEFSFPSLSEQERIATILSDMDAEIEVLEQQLDKARQIKQGMMQELLTGRTRLV